MFASTDTANDSLTIIKETCKSDELPISICKQFQSFFEDHLFLDVTLVVKDVDKELKIKAHKLVLCAASKYFLAMFGGSFRESNEKEIHFNHVDSQSLEKVINYIYTASIELATDTVEEIAKTAHLFELESLKILCCGFIGKQLDPTNCVGIYLYADKYNFTALYEDAFEYICKNFEKVCIGKEFLELDVDHLSVILSSDELQVQSEETVFHCIMTWIEHDEANRQNGIESVIRLVRFPHIKPSFIIDVIEPICKTIESERLLYIALKWHFFPKLRSSLFSEQCVSPRYCGRSLIAIFGWNLGNTSNLNVGEFNLKTDNWTYTTYSAPKVRREKFESIVWRNKLIIAGGYTNIHQNSNNLVDCLDLDTLEWTDMPPMRTMRFSFGMATLKDYIYVFGGFDSPSSNNNVRNMEKYDPVTNAWEYIAGSEQILSNSTAISLSVKKRILCAAVKNQHGQIGLHFFDPAAETWTKNVLIPVTNPLGFGTVTFKKQKLFIVVSRNAILKYDLTDDSQISIPFQTMENEYTNCAMFADYVVIFGNTKFKIYYPFTDQWRTIPNLNNNLGRVVLITNYAN